MKQAVIVPTYWAREGGEWRRGDLVFDHPTPLDEEGTLWRCLESLNKLDGKFNLFLIVVPTHLDIQENLERKMIDKLNRLSLKYDLIPVFPSTISEVQGCLKGEPIGEVLNLNGYPQVRNACLLIPFILGSEIFIMLDDDEVVLDKDFLNKAVEYLGENFRGRRIVAKAGVYLQAHGTPFFKDKDVWWRAFLRSKEAMNEAFKVIELGERIVDTPFAFGGNMVVSNEVVSKGICFDPYVPRGEDTDFLVNVKSEGYAFVLDTALKILHLPPKPSSPDWMELRQNALRFLYMRTKLKRSKMLGVKRNVSPSDLAPYPGRFLDWTLKHRLLVTSLLLSLDYAGKRMLGESRKALWNIELLLRSYREQLARYNIFRKKWRDLVPSLINRSDLKEILLAKTVKARK